MTPIQSLLVAHIGPQITINERLEIIEERNEPIHKLWDKYTMGINPNVPNVKEQMTQVYFNKRVEYKENQYWIRLPWKLISPPLPSNYINVKDQLNNLWDQFPTLTNHLHQ